MNGLDDMYLFKHVVEAGSISAAARRFHFAKSTLARRITALEDRLGMPLFHRNARGFQLTNFGQACYEKCRTIADQADDIIAMSERMRQSPSGFLHVVCPPLLGSLIVEKFAAEFAVKAPDVHLHLEETTGIYDPRSVQADLVLYPSFQHLPDSTLIARQIFTSQNILVASTDKIDGAKVTHPEALNNLNCLGLGPRGSDWFWLLTRDKQSIKFRYEPTFTTTQPTALLQAVRCGLGVARLPELLCREDLSSGRLIQLLPQWKPEPITIYAIFPSRKTMTVAARHFLDLLIERLKRFE